METRSFVAETHPSVFLCVIVLLAGAFAPSTLWAQSDEKYPTVEYRAVFQPRASYGVVEGGVPERFGFGLRRARMRVDIGLTDRVVIRYDADFSGGSFRSVDLYGMYTISPSLRLSVGVLPGAQPRANILTSMTVIDGIDRPVIAEQWGRATIGSNGRDFGVDLRYQTSDWTLVAFLHNGDGSFSGDRGNFSPRLSRESVTGEIDRTVLATSFYVEHRPAFLPGAEIGGYIGQNPSKNPNTEDSAGEGREFISYAAHAYYGAVPGSQPFRLKFDLVGINYRGDEDQEWFGVSVLGAVRLKEYMEVFARYQNIQEDTRFDGTDFVSAGMSFSLSKMNGGSYSTHRITFGYGTFESPAGVQQHQLQVQLQVIIAN